MKQQPFSIYCEKFRLNPRPTKTVAARRFVSALSIEERSFTSFRMTAASCFGIIFCLGITRTTWLETGGACGGWADFAGFDAEAEAFDVGLG